MTVGFADHFNRETIYCSTNSDLLKMSTNPIHFNYLSSSENSSFIAVLVFRLNICIGMRSNLRGYNLSGKEQKQA